MTIDSALRFCQDEKNRLRTERDALAGKLRSYEKAHAKLHEYAVGKSNQYVKALAERDQARARAAEMEDALRWCARWVYASDSMVALEAHIDAALAPANKPSARCCAGFLSLCAECTEKLLARGKDPTP